MNATAVVEDLSAVVRNWRWDKSMEPVSRKVNLVLQTDMQQRSEIVGQGVLLGFAAGMFALWLRRAGLRRSIIVLSSGAGGCVLFFLSADLIPQTYRSESAQVAEWPERIASQALSHDGIAELRAKRKLFENELGKDQIEGALANIRKRIQVSYDQSPGALGVMRIAVTWNDAVIARDLNQELVSTIYQLARRDGSKLEALEPPTLPERPTFPWRDLFCWFGLAAGIAFGLHFTKSHPPHYRESGYSQPRASPS